MTIRQRISRWLNPPTEKRAGYTDVLTQAIIAQANLSGSIYSGAMEIAAGTYSGAMEIAAGTYSRALSSAVASGRDARYFTATVMGEIGRDLIEGGESVWLVGENTLRHVPALDIEHPGRTLHLRYSTDVHSGRGIGPLGRANALVNLANTIENSLAKEAGALVGYILPIPTDGQDSSVDQLRLDLQQLDGKIALVETAVPAFDAPAIGIIARTPDTLMSWGKQARDFFWRQF